MKVEKQKSRALKMIESSLPPANEVFTPVHREGVSAPLYAGKTPLRILRDTVNKWTGRILLECILVLITVYNAPNSNFYIDQKVLQ